MTTRWIFEVPSPISSTGASRTVATEVSMSPERQNSLTIDWATMFGEM
jgi:hypothetical protein